MTKVLLTGLVVGAQLTVAAPATAQWQGQASLGIANSSGNSDNSSISGTAGLSRKLGQWQHHLIADVHQAKTDGVKSADRLMLGYKADRNFSERLYGFGSMRYETDEFSDIDQRLTAMVGLGHHTLLGPVHTLDLEVGLGYSTTEFVSAMADSNQVVVGLAARYSGKLTDTLSLTERLTVEIGDDNTLTESVTGLSYKLSNAMSLTAAYTLRRNSDIVGARGEKTDKLFTINLGVSF